MSGSLATSSAWPVSTATQADTSTGAVAVQPRWSYSASTQFVSTVGTDGRAPSSAPTWVITPSIRTWLLSLPYSSAQASSRSGDGDAGALRFFWYSPVDSSGSEP